MFYYSRRQTALSNVRTASSVVSVGLVLALGVAGCSQPMVDSQALATPHPSTTSVEQTIVIEEVDQSASDTATETPITAHKLGVVGEIEWVCFPPQEAYLEARIDTGATTSSVHASNVEPFDRDGQDWVRFNLEGRGEVKPVTLEKPIARRVLIRDGGGEPSLRYVVPLNIQMGELIVKREFTLADRSGLTFSVLIGRNLLDGVALVDVGRSHLLPKAKMPDRVTAEP